MSRPGRAASRTRAPKRAPGTFFSLRLCPVRPSARYMPKNNTILTDGVIFWSGRRGNRRRAAGGGRSEAISRKCPDWRPRQWPGIGWHDGEHFAGGAGDEARWRPGWAATRTRAPKRAPGTFLSLRSCPVRASARYMPKNNTILTDGVIFWSGRRGSNSLPRPWQGRALPDELRPQNNSYYNA